jgi:ATP-dependent protease ClpP protease subunit
MAALPDFRENPARGVFVTGEITEELVHRLCPVITDLRFSSTDPITVFIDSRGGSVRSGKHIENLLRAKDQERRTHAIITVATTQAKSAAAMLLSSGDYALAYPTAEIMFHGSRIPEEAEITTEKASSLAQILGSINEDDALDLAELMFPRLVFLHIFFRRHYDDPVGEKIEPVLNGPPLASLIRKRIRPGSRKMIDAALKELAELDNLGAHLDKANLPIGPADPQGKVEMELLKGILDFEEKRNDLKTWNLTGGGLDQVRRDFLLLSKHLTKYALDINKKVHLWGRFFLDEAIKAEFEKATDEKAKVDLLVKHATPGIETLWNFAVMLANVLQGRDCNLTAEEAYWLGLVDEVVGSSLPSKRLAAEAG